MLIRQNIFFSLLFDVRKNMCNIQILMTNFDFLVHRKFVSKKYAIVQFLHPPLQEEEKEIKFDVFQDISDTAENSGHG